MRKLIPLTLPLALLACNPVDTYPPVGLANPASVYCSEQGGEVVIRNTEEGQTGDCHLPGGRVIEEWEFYRANN
ncbi:putative hemolysin [Halocynthiibacter styelae]|uniref:DUF333 domain-containing protein n=1 Tax=Halocynthiibacter styelae TaxID=2761955 RepID=A0A8J7LJQ0_9RHOB|nr:DUF333 domain-containing protein [Paenihalocynthiibacter styelae]MBI1492620.1 DUF333 domain-containing protein [Paenihalocynthiibacter styelae]